MSIERLTFPLPAVVKGFVCLNQSEMELAEKNIDPARPNDTPPQRDPPPQYTPAEAEKKSTPPDSPPEPKQRIVSYTPDSVRTEGIEKATVYSFKA